MADWADSETEFEDVVLTAPDGGHDEFDSHFKPKIDALVRNLTVYVSSNDLTNKDSILFVRALESLDAFLITFGYGILFLIFLSHRPEKSRVPEVLVPDIIAAIEASLMQVVNGHLDNLFRTRRLARARRAGLHSSGNPGLHLANRREHAGV